MNHPGAVSAYNRLLESGKHLFATRGYGNSSTIMIARAAGTSESQLVKHFGSKDGLLEAIFERGWESLMPAATDIAPASPAAHLRALLAQIVTGMERDPELRDLFMLESRRVRRDDNAVMLSRGYSDFVRQIDGALTALRDAGQLSPELPVGAMRAAILGMYEGLLRDRILAQRSGRDPGYSADDMRRVTDGLLAALGLPPE